MVLVAVMVAISAAEMMHYTLLKQPLHDSALSGAAWVQELINGNPARIKTELGVYQHTFTTLVEALRKCGVVDSLHVMAAEQVAIFLLICVGNTSNSRAAGRFQRSGETISKYTSFLNISILLTAFSQGISSCTSGTQQSIILSCLRETSSSNIRHSSRNT